MSDEAQTEARVRARLREYADAVVPVSDVPAVGRARYRRRVRRQRAGAVIAAALVVVGASGLGVELSRRPAHRVQVGTAGESSSAPSSASTTAFTPATAQPGATITGQSVADTTWISDDIGWTLFPDGVLHTTDGGKTWRYLSPTPFGVDGASGACGIDCVSHIRFADARHGWIFGTAFAATGDGGRTWRQVTAPPVVALEVEHGRAYRLISEGGGCPGPCDYALQTSTVGSDVWNGVRTPDIGPGTEAQLLYDGPRLYVVAYQSATGSTERHLIGSTDAGAAWAQRADPCSVRPDDRLVQLAAAPDGFVAALCFRSDGGTYVRTSSDAATTFGSARSLPRAFSSRGESSVAIAAGSPTSVAVVRLVGASWVVDVSHDDGRSWAATLTVAANGPTAVTFLGFENAFTGRVAVRGNQLWTTRDGGDTWSVGSP